MLWRKAQMVQRRNGRFFLSGAACATFRWSPHQACYVWCSEQINLHHSEHRMNGSLFVVRCGWCWRRKNMHMSCLFVGARVGVCSSGTTERDGKQHRWYEPRQPKNFSLWTKVGEKFSWCFSRLMPFEVLSLSIARRMVRGVCVWHANIGRYWMSVRNCVFAVCGWCKSAPHTKNDGKERKKERKMTEKIYS